VQYSVRDFVDAAFKEVGTAVRWEGEGIDEKGYDAESGNLLVEVDPRYFRPTEVETLLGDSTKAREKLGWVPEITLEEMVGEMVRGDLNIAERDEMCRREGFTTFDYNE
jgi:GDPmannose 4,6-dehydratase